MESSSTLRNEELSQSMVMNRNNSTSVQDRLEQQEQAEELREWFDQPNQPKNRYRQQYSNIEERVLRLRKIAEASISI